MHKLLKIVTTSTVIDTLKVRYHLRYNFFIYKLNIDFHIRSIDRTPKHKVNKKTKKIVPIISNNYHRKLKANENELIF